LAYVLSGKINEARVAYEKIVSSVCTQDELDQAVSAFSDALRANPNIPGAQELLGRLKAAKF
jgi:GrpB-like predicted nucleotidyltransferase (UPF0157 family)